MLKNFIGFDKLIGTSLIKTLYYLGLLTIILMGVSRLLSAFSFTGGDFTIELGDLLVAFIATPIVAVVWRFMCEIYMLFFRMSDDLRDIKNHQLGLQANDKEVDIDL